MGIFYTYFWTCLNYFLIFNKLAKNFRFFLYLKLRLLKLSRQIENITRNKYMTLKKLYLFSRIYTQIENTLE